ncbi:MAG TPA: hypothetical protein VLA44_03570 [Clostridia bacterium]|nr:hypothetical protein [Clostridia bacterium]
MNTRILRAALGAAFLVVLGSGLVSAGGWATIVADEAAPPEPREGEEVEYGFTVLQHGETPAGWEQPTLVLTNTLTGETFDVPTTPSGPDGHFVGRVTFPSAGSWSWSVRLRDLIVETQPVTGMVLAADGSRPSIDVGQALGAMERAKKDVSAALRSEFLPRIDRLERSLGGVQEQAAGLRNDVEALTVERDRLAAQVAAAGEAAPSGIPPLGVVTIAVLSGALAGFLVAWLGVRREVVSVESAPAGRPVATA